MIATGVGVLVASLVGSVHCAGMCGGFVCFYAGSASGNEPAALRAHLRRCVCPPCPDGDMVTMGCQWWLQVGGGGCQALNRQASLQANKPPHHTACLLRWLCYACTFFM